MSAKSGEALSRRTSSIVRRRVDVGPHRDVRRGVGALHHARGDGLADAAHRDRLLARLDRLGQRCARGAGRMPRHRRPATGIVSSRTSPHSGVSMLRNTSPATRASARRRGSPRRPGRSGVTCGEVDAEVAGELADRRLRDDADGCLDPLLRASATGLRRRDCDVTAGAVADEHRTLAARPAPRPARRARSARRSPGRRRAAIGRRRS